MAAAAWRAGLRTATCDGRSRMSDAAARHRLAPDRARRAAAHRGRRVRAHPPAARRCASSGLEPRDRALVTDLVYGTVRMQRALDFMLAAVSNRGIGSLDPPVRAALRLGAYQLLIGVPAHAAVGETVGRRRRARPRLRQRRAARAGAQGPAVPAAGGRDVESIALRTSHPDWIVRMFVDAFGADDAIATLELDNDAAAGDVAREPAAHGIDRGDDRRARRGGRRRAARHARARRAAVAAHRRSRRAARDRRRPRHAPGPGEPGDRRGARSAAGRAHPRSRVGARAARRPPRPSAWRARASSSPPTSIPGGCARCARAAERIGAAVDTVVTDRRRRPSSRRCATARSTGCCSTRRAAGSACCAAGPTRAGACSPSDVRDLAALQRVLLAAAADAVQARRPARLRGVHAVAGGDARHRRVGARRTCPSSSPSRRPPAPWRRSAAARSCCPSDAQTDGMFVLSLTAPRAVT